MSAEDGAGPAQAAVEAVLRASGEGRLISLEELLGEPGVDGLAGQDQRQAAAALAQALADDERLACFRGHGGQTWYHAPDLLSQTYARILDRKASPLLLMAEEIRLNSREYPRPLPVELFEAPPFDLSPEDITCVLRAMAADPAYQDITFTQTEGGAVYLFSTLHLERPYAAFLAQRAESMQGNP